MRHGFNLSAWAITHRSFVSFLLLVLLLAGTWSYFQLGRNEDPPYTIETMIVQAAWPGANVSDTLEQVTERLERKLQELPYIDNVRSFSAAGQTTIFVTVKGSTPRRIMPDLWYQVRKKVGDIRHELPQGIIGPFFNDEFGDGYGIIYAFTADGFTHRELRDYVEAARSRLQRVPDISKIDVVGAQNEQIVLEFSVEKLSGLGVSPNALIQALQSQNAITPAGVMNTGDEKLLIRTTGAFQSEADLRQVNFVANGRLFRLTDVGTVRRGYTDPPQPLFRINGQSAIALAIAMRDGGDILTLGRNVHAAMAEVKGNLPIGIEPIVVADQPLIVRDAVGEFLKALWEAVAIVLAVSFLSLGLRAGMVVALSIPVVLAIVFVGMQYAGIDLQRVSLGALIIALGLLVDDAMITVESMITRLEAGDSKAEAATFAYVSTAFPMLTGTLVTVAGFIPIGFAKSGAGEYTFSLFAVVAIALIASWFVAVVFAPLIGVSILSDKIKAHHAGEPGWAMRAFRRVLVASMRWKWVTIILTIGLFVLSLVGAQLVPQQFFPAADRPELLVDFKLPHNASIHATEKAAASLDDLLRDDNDVVKWSTYVGRGAVRFYLPLNVQLPNDSFSQVVIVTKSLEARERLRKRLEGILEERLPSVISRIYPLEIGPPIGWPLQYRITGPEIEKVRDIAYEVANTLGSYPRVEKVNFDWVEPARTLKVRVDQDEARLLGISSEAVSQALNIVVSGFTITQVRDSTYLIDVVARAGEAERGSLATLRTLQIALPSGRTVPLSQIASIEHGQEYPLVWRRDRMPTLTVQADLPPGLLPEPVVKALAPKMAELNAALPADYAIRVGGTAEESEKSVRSVLAVVPAMLMLILLLLMIQLQSFQRLFLVLSVAPLGVIGVVAALLLANKPLGFVAILGVMALIGMIVRNSVILVDQVDVEIAHGRSPWDAVVEATSHRFRPIILTSAAAILALIPIVPTVFWGPMATAMMGGLAVATFLTLFFLPALYVAWFRVREHPPAIKVRERELVEA